MAAPGTTGGLSAATQPHQCLWASNVEPVNAPQVRGGSDDSEEVSTQLLTKQT